MNTKIGKNKLVKNRKGIALLLVLCILAVSCLSGCALTEGLKMAKTVNRFQKAAQEMDVEAMLDCMNPSLKNKIEGSMGVLSIFGVDSSDVFGKISELLLGTVGSSEGEDLLSKISIKKVKVKVKGDEGEFTGILRYEMDGGAVEKKCAIKMIKENDEWYISGFSLVE